MIAVQTLSGLFIGLANNLLEVFEDEQEPGQLIERFVSVPQRCVVAVLFKKRVADAVNGADSELREISRILCPW